MKPMKPPLAPTEPLDDEVPASGPQWRAPALDVATLDSISSESWRSPVTSAILEATLSC
jgi:hypothetical protein